MQLTNNELTALMGTTEDVALAESPFREDGRFDAASLDAAIAKVTEDEAALPVALRVCCEMCKAPIGVACAGPKTHLTRKVMAGRGALRPLSRS